MQSARPRIVELLRADRAGSRSRHYRWHIACNELCMSNASDVKEADQARTALISDIQELKGTGRQVVSQARSALPWVIGGAVGVLAIVIALKPPRRSFEAQPSLLGKAVRAAALSAVGILTRHLLTRALNKALPEPQPANARVTA
jgi:hypothetical protein